MRSIVVPYVYLIRSMDALSIALINLQRFVGAKEVLQTLIKEKRQPVYVFVLLLCVLTSNLLLFSGTWYERLAELYHVEMKQFEQVEVTQI